MYLLVWPIHFGPDHIFLSHSVVVDYVLVCILMQSSCCCLTTLNTRTRTEDADRVGQSVSPNAQDASSAAWPSPPHRFTPCQLHQRSQQQCKLHTSASPRRDLHTSTNQPTRRGPKLTLIRLAIAAIGKHPTKVFQIWTKEIFDTLSRLWKTQHIDGKHCFWSFHSNTLKGDWVSEIQILKRMYQKIETVENQGLISSKRQPQLQSALVFGNIKTHILCWFEISEAAVWSRK